MLQDSRRKTLLTCMQVPPRPVQQTYIELLCTSVWLQPKLLIQTTADTSYIILNLISVDKPVYIFFYDLHYS